MTCLSYTSNQLKSEQVSFKISFSVFLEIFLETELGKGQRNQAI
jgi:hypothetical protein